MVNGKTMTSCRTDSQRVLRITRQQKTDVKKVVKFSSPTNSERKRPRFGLKSSNAISSPTIGM